MQEIKIETEYIKLDQFLKYVSVVQTGGEAKMLIENRLIKVNNEITIQRGKKIRKNDIIEIEGHNSFLVI